jgi:nicotinate phosphoribosyltransferase
VVFPNEPLLQVRGNLLEGQLVETYLLSLMNFQTLVASKAARLRLVAGERRLIDFGTRRAHGPEAGMHAARAAWVGGFNGTSNVLAAHLLGIPVVGTAAHAYTMAFDSEEAAFAHYAATFPESTTLLIDTYDTLRGAARAAALGPVLQGVRLDSGDLAALSREVRALLDARGLPGARIVASNDLNELKIQELLAAGAPIDTFGVGTELVTSKDDPALAGVYKLVEKLVDGVPVPTMKFSPSKNTYPGRKDLYRVYDAQGRITAGVLAQVDETPEALPGERLEALLRPVDPRGAAEPLADIQARTLAQLQALPPALAEVTAGGEWEPPALRVTPATLADMEACAARIREA